MAEVERLELREAEFQEGAVDREKQVRRTEFFQRFLQLRVPQRCSDTCRSDPLITPRFRHAACKGWRLRDRQ